MRENGAPWARSAALFVLTAWPAWLVPLPPLQDLPNHLATAWVQLHPADYPELVSNGFLKTNSALFFFLHVAGHVVSLRLAAKLFVTLVALVSAIAYPLATARLGGHAKTAVFFMTPMVHNWFVAMGMLDYALAVPLVLATLVALAAHRREPSLARGLLAGALAMSVWYTHAFGVAALAALVVVDVVARRAWSESRTLGPPLALPIALTAWSAIGQVFGDKTVTSLTTYEGSAALGYGLFAEWWWSLTKWTLVAIVPCVVAAWYGVRRWREQPAFFSPLAMALIAAVYVLSPSHAAHWFYVSSRMLPFLWFGCLLRVPSELPAWLRGALAIASLAFSGGLAMEYTRVSADWAEVARAEEAVPQRARLLPIVFDRKGPHGDNTWPMLHVWGLFVIDRGTSAPLAFAHSPSFPIMYASEPPLRFHGMTLEELPRTMKSSADLCRVLATAGVVPRSCADLYRATWDEFWHEAAPRFDRVLVYGPTTEFRDALPPSFRVVYDHDATLVLATSPE